MKTKNQILLIILLCVSYNTAIAQNLSFMPDVKRDSLLISIAKEVILKYGPDYYREYKQPVISYKQYPSVGKINDKRFTMLADRYYYVVTYLYDKTEETLEWDYAAEVRIWEDTGNPSGVMFGNGIGTIVTKEDWRNDTTIEPIAYQDATAPRIYVITIEVPEHIVGEKEREEYIKQAEKNATPEPANKDELIRNGWVRESDGRWVRTRPEAPPASAQIIIQREIAKMKEAEARNKINLEN